MALENMLQHNTDQFTINLYIIKCLGSQVIDLYQSGYLEPQINNLYRQVTA